MTSVPAGASSCSPTPGATLPLVNMSSGKALNVRGSSGADGALAEQWSFAGWPSQLCTFASDGPGYRTITNVGGGKRIDVNGSSTADGASVLQWFATGGRNQQWTVSSADSESPGPHSTRRHSHSTRTSPSHEGPLTGPPLSWLLGRDVTPHAVPGRPNMHDGTPQTGHRLSRPAARPRPSRWARLWIKAHRALTTPMQGG